MAAPPARPVLTVSGCLLCSPLHPSELRANTLLGAHPLLPPARTGLYSRHDPLRHDPHHVTIRSPPRCKPPVTRTGSRKPPRTPPQRSGHRNRKEPWAQNRAKMERRSGSHAGRGGDQDKQALLTNLPLSRIASLPPVTTDGEGLHEQTGLQAPATPPPP